MIASRVIGGRYVVLGELGRGRLGVAWRAQDRVTGRQVAVQELHLCAGLSPAEHARFRERLLRAVRATGRLDHPGFVAVHDVVSDEGVDHIVTELVEAPTLAEAVAQDGPLDERAATDVARQVLAALRRAHTAGVVHGDLTPGTVLLGPGGRVAVAAVGIAQAADDPRLVARGGLVGSPEYTAPERLAGEPVAPAGDLWALGATLFHAVRGGPPVRPDAGGDAPADVGPVSREPLRAVIAGLLIHSPRDRLDGGQAAALLDTRPPRRRAFRRRHA